MDKKIPLVIATRNPGKTAEIRDLLKDFAVEIKNLDDLGPIPVAEEDGKTFDDNAYKKASFTAKILGIPALADDFLQGNMFALRRFAWYQETLQGFKQPHLFLIPSCKPAPLPAPRLMARQGCRAWLAAGA